jgi:hypothetical protein
MPTHSRPKLSQRSLDFIRALLGPESAMPMPPQSRLERVKQFLIDLTAPGVILIIILWFISLVALIILGRDYPFRTIALTAIIVIAITMILPGALIKHPTTTIFIGTTAALGLLRFYDYMLIDERAHNGITTLVLGLVFIYLSKLNEEQSNAQKRPLSRRFLLLFVCGIASIAVGMLALVFYDQEPDPLVALIHGLASMHTLLFLIAIYSIRSQSADQT